MKALTSVVAAIIVCIIMIMASFIVIPVAVILVAVELASSLNKWLGDIWEKE